MERLKELLTPKTFNKLSSVAIFFETCIVQKEGLLEGACNFHVHV